MNHPIVGVAYAIAGIDADAPLGARYDAYCRLQQALRPARKGGTYVDVRCDDSITRMPWGERGCAWTRVSYFSGRRVRFEAIWPESPQFLRAILAAEIESLCAQDPLLREREAARQRYAYAAQAAMIAEGIR